MKKIFFVLVLLVSLAVNAQTSRISIGLGGGCSINANSGKIENLCYPMGTVNLGYTYLVAVRSDAMLGFRTGLTFSFAKIGNAIAINESFTNIDYYQNIIDYTVTSKNTIFKQQQFNIEMPFMFAVKVKGLYFNLGTKFILPIWNKYEQVIEGPQISAYYPDIDVTVVNDIITGVLSDDQLTTTGKAETPSLMIGLSAEIGHVWKLKNESGSLGFDFFLDYLPWSVGGIKDNNKSIVEVAPIENDCEQPKSSVTVNPMNQCNGFVYRNVCFGLKLVYMFDITHKNDKI